ncbi:uncharacterized protein LOC130712177 [Lotus japonicus]|uniref:uncharacterized protein LOC130712177 n=1 Tax=Lotus japonicus TaxID=34305 RepID=UPI00258B3FC1|nr:uncharacterized protein LOC130712177 [Lotus japonicus]
MGYGGLVRDSAGSWIIGFMAGTGGGGPLLAEIKALKSGLEILWEKGEREVICEVDCLELVHVIHHQREQFHALALEFRELQLLLSRDWRVQLLHISRDANTAADCLAHLGSVSQCDLSRLEVPPPQLLPFLARDALAL